ncbi:IS110 family transposase [Streptomyces sp. NWU339]|uniref:IS110 family transposase n=1 Tax=Streptomyces sp. NWU339 TaxID=2185284 RepID=UPI000D67C337|nr:IS110 family transposase [Streptomyces sp. NWU339]PWI08874.1 IS110 family transposase [Streptomyces sp. NWU339]
MPQLWAGTDAGKSEHHCTVIDAEGERRLSRRLANDETTLLELIGDVLELSEGEPVTWAVDLNAGGAALLIALSAAHGQKVLYIPGRTVHHASGSYRGDGKTDAKDAYVIADRARMRRDLHPLQEQDEIAVDLRILTARRYDLTADRTRAINRLRAQLLEYFPALERAFNYSTSKAALVLLAGYRTPTALRRIGRTRLAGRLSNRKVRNARTVAATALEAAQAQHTAIPGERTAAAMVRTLAAAVMALDEEIARTDALIEARFREHAHAAAITSMPGMGGLLGAEFIACTGGDLDAIGSSRRLAGIAGLAPLPKDSGRISGNMRRPRRYHRRRLCVFCLSAQVAARYCPTSRTFYGRKRSEGKSHKQAVLALARRRLDVLWALIRDRRTFTVEPPQRGLAAA